MSSEEEQQPSPKKKKLEKEEEEIKDPGSSYWFIQSVAEGLEEQVTDGKLKKEEANQELLRLLKAVLNNRIPAKDFRNYDPAYEADERYQKDIITFIT